MEEIKTPENFISYCESLEMTDIPDAFAQLNEDLKENSTVQDFVLEKNGFSFQYFDDRYNRDKEYILNKIGLSTEAALMLKFVDDSLAGDDDLLEAACKVSMSAHKWLDRDKWNKDSEWYKKIAAYNYGTIHFMPDEIKNSVEMCKAFLDIDMRSYNVFSDEMKANRAVQEYALKKDGYVFNIFPDRFKCDKDYIKSMLADCLDKSDARSYMIFAVCEELQDDQELINLAIERNRFVFEEMFPEKTRNKQLFIKYVKVNPQIYKYVPESLKDDREIIKSIILGRYNDAVRKKYFEESSFYNDLNFARDVISESEFVGTYKMLKPDFKSDKEILSIFTSKFQNARDIGFIANEALTEEIAEEYIQRNFNAVCHIKNEEITKKLFNRFQDRILKETQYNPDFYRGMTGYLSYMPEVFRAFMKNPLITALDLDQVNYYISTNDELTPERERLMEHLKKPFLKNLYNEKKKDDSFGFYAKGIQRKNYIDTLDSSDSEILRLMVSDEYRWVREAAARKILFSDLELFQILENGIPIIVKNKNDWTVVQKHDRYVLRGLLFNENVKAEIKEQLNELLKNEEKYPKQFDLYEIGYYDATGPIESAAGYVEEENIVDSIIRNGGIWNDYLQANDWRQSLTDFWHIEDMREPATNVKLPDGAFESIEISPGPKEQMYEEPELKNYIGDGGEGFIAATKVFKTEGWDNWKKYQVKLEFEFDPAFIIPIYENGFCVGYEYKNEKESASFTVDDNYSSNSSKVDSELYYYKGDEYEVLNPKNVVKVVAREGGEVSDRASVSKYLKYYLASYFNNYSKILDKNGFNFKNFPKDKLPLLPFSVPVKYLRWHEGSDRFIEIVMDQEIPMEARLEKGIMYYGDNFLINDVFQTPLLLTTQGVATKNPIDHAAQDYIFIPFENFNIDVGLYQHEATKLPLIRLAGDNDEFTITSDFTDSKNPFVHNDEVLFVYNIIKQWMNIVEVTPYSISVPGDAYIYLGGLVSAHDNLDKELYKIITSIEDHQPLLKTVSELMTMQSSDKINAYAEMFKSDASETEIENTIKGLQLIHDKREKLPGNLAYFLCLIGDDRLKANSYHIDIDEVRIPFTFLQSVTPPSSDEEVEIDRRGYAKEKCLLTYEDRNKFVHDLELMLTPSASVEHQADHEDFNNISYSYDEEIYNVVDLGGKNVELDEDDLEFIEDDFEYLQEFMILEDDLELEISKMVIETAPEVSFEELTL